MSNISSADIFICDLSTVRPHKLAMTTITSQAIVIGIIKDDDCLQGISEVATIGGARILTDLIYEMKRRGTKVGLAAMCIGVGQGISLMVDNVE